jgi:hypothetical protein
VWVWWANQSSIYTCSGPSQGCFSSLVGGELSRLVCPPRRVDYIRILMFSTKAEPHYPAENPKELLHENSPVRRESIKMRIFLNTSQLGFRERHSTTLQCMRLTNHVIINSSSSKQGLGRTACSDFISFSLFNSIACSDGLYLHIPYDHKF